MKSNRHLASAAVLSLLALSSCTTPQGDANRIWEEAAADGAGGGGGDPLVIDEPGATLDLLSPFVPRDAPPDGETASGATTTETVTPTDTDTKSDTGTDTGTDTGSTTSTSTGTVLAPTETTTPTSTDTSLPGGVEPGTAPGAGTQPGTMLGPTEQPGSSQPSIAPGAESSPVPRAPEDACPGRWLTLLADAPVYVTGSLDGMRDDLVTTCAPPGLTGSPDQVYLVEVSELSFVHVFFSSSSFSPVISLHKESCGQAASDECLFPAGSEIDDVLSLDAGRYWFILESSDGQSGPFELRLDAIVVP